MSLSIGIVGLPNVGKSTLFNALTRQSADAANYPFCTIDPSVGIVEVPDERLIQLSKLSNSAKTIPAAVEFVDIAGLVRGASKGEGLGNKFLSNIREVDAIAEVVRVFDSTDITHVSGKVDPLDDIEVINLELILADLQVISKRLAALEKDIRGNKKGAKEEHELLSTMAEVCEAGKLLKSMELSEEDIERIKYLNLLTTKPILYVLNVAEGTAIPEELLSFFKERGDRYVVVNARAEEELKDMEGEEKKAFKEELGVSESNMEGLIIAGYETLDLITFFTTGETETRGWTTRRDSTGPEAGAAIHTDFKDNYIRAQVIFWKDLIESGSYAVAREKGLVRIEGKEYIVQDGDVIEFKI